MRHWLTFCLAILLLVAGSAQPVKKAHVQSELISDQTVVAPGSTFWVGLRLEMEPEWHTYWQNPGDGGLATKIEWTLPEGVTAGPIQWPAPERVELAGLVSFGYSHEVVLLTQLQTAPDLKSGPLTLKANVSYLACKEECIPGQADLTLKLSAGAASQPSEQAESLARARDQLPLGPDPAVQARLEGTKILLSLPPGTQKAEFFPLDNEQIKLDAPQTLKQDQLELQAAEKAPARLSGVLVMGDKSYQVDLPLTTGGAAAQAPQVSFLPAFLSAFLGGLLLNLMPCVFPVLSMKVLGFVEAAGESKGKPWMHGLVFTLGVLVSFWALTAALLAVKAGGAKVGWGFQLQEPGIVIALAVLFFALGLNFLGVFEIGLTLTRLGDVAEQKSGLSGAFWSGVLATLAATPCTAPFMGSAVGFALTAPVLQTFLIFTSLGLGMAFPYLVLSSVPALLRFVPRPGPWMESFKQFLAFPLLATTGGLLWVLGQQRGSNAVAVMLQALVLFGMAAWAYGRWGFSIKTGVRARGLAFTALLLVAGLAVSMQAARFGGPSGHWQSFSPEKVAELRAAGKPVFVDFTAAWCFSCQVNEQVALKPKEVLDAFQARGITMLKADWTNRDEVITRELEKFGRSGVPLYVLYPAGGEPEVLPQVLTPSIVLKALEKIPTSSSAN
ncbi:thiol:disulfide interchange protein [bacterium CPR1]|nr:thiol:disulfide interchange protein [bacterium CPR1]